MNDQPVILVTGASRGLGSAVACWLGRRGAVVGLTARTKNALEDTARDVRRLGGEAMILPGDVGRFDDCERAVEGVVSRFGRLDGLVNNAGIVQPLAPVAETDPAEWRRNLEVNLLGPYFLARAAMGALRAGSGRMVNVSSGAAQLVIESASAYCAAKAALTHFTRILAAEEPTVTAVAFRPGVVDTAMQEVLRSAGGRGMPPEQAAYYRRLKEQGELLPPHVPARCAAWLVLEAPASMSGRFVSHEDPEVADPARAAFGEHWED